MINDNKAFNLRVKAASKLKAIPPSKTTTFILDNQVRVKTKSDSDFNKNFKVLLTQASNAMREGNYENAVHLFTNILKQDPEDFNVIIDRAFCFQQLGKTKLALKDLDTILFKKPDHARAILMKAEILYDSGDYRSALSFFEAGYQKRKDMTAFEIGIRKTKRSIESSRTQMLIQPDNLLDSAVKQKNLLGELNEDFNFLSEYEANSTKNDSIQKEIKELIGYIQQQQEKLAKTQ